MIAAGAASGGSHVGTREDCPRVLMLIPSATRRDVDALVRDDLHPLPDYTALQRALCADLADYDTIRRDYRLLRIATAAGKDTALAMYGFRRRRRYDAIFSNGENVSIPLALLLRGSGVRPRHVLIGHRVTPLKKRPFLQMLGSSLDAMFVYATPQAEYATAVLRMQQGRVHRIPFHADARFFRPSRPSPEAPERMICSAGLEWRDYPTLIEAVRGLDVDVRLAAASPWSKHRNETAGRALPVNVSARRYDYAELRQLYADARFVVVPLYQNDFQAGITTVLEAMAMGKAVIATRTHGQIDTIRDGVNGLYVPPGDPAALRTAICRLLDSPDEAERLGRQARCELLADMTLDHWVERITNITRDVCMRNQDHAADH